MPTYTVSILTANSDKFDGLENLVVSGKSVRQALDSVERQLDTKIRAKGYHYKLARSNSILFIERYSPCLPTLADFQNLPDPEPAPRTEDYKTEPEGFWHVTVLETVPEGYKPTHLEQVRARTRLGAFRVFKKDPPADWKRYLHYWMDSDYRLLYIAKTPAISNLPAKVNYSVELFKAPHPKTTYSLSACNPWHAAVYLGDTLGIEFENRRYLDVTDRFDAEDGTYCLVHSRRLECQFSI